MGTYAEQRLTQGARYPYDASDDWTFDDAALLAADWAHAAARGVLADLNDRAGIKHGFRCIDEDIRAEIVSDLAEIIRTAALTTSGT